ncbi:heterokaryon incompatibility protein-domain-containing protein [Diaporthe sp. PMI_573]|nr:heterokaryon incompatibility protein-domain-containing protein [Diaporthaceae sp. PMI_573]
MSGVQIKKITLTRKTQAQLAEDESIVYGQASLTIIDAMELCRRLGIQYIWVDALCIIQDDENDKADQLKAMSHIYRCASFTIVAASDQDAGAGLPGLRPGTRCFQQKEVLVAQATESKPALSLMTTCNPKSSVKVHYLEETKCNTRGWTFQERYLSSRCLVFTEEQVYFSCNEAIFCEESYSEHGPPYLQPFENSGSELSLNAHQQYTEPTDASDRLWRRYRAVVERYTRRNLGFQGDVYDAFKGLEKALLYMYGERLKLLWGLPCKRLSMALTWDTFSGQVRRKALSTLRMTDLNRRVSFPSWSWMGWVGETHLSVTDDRLELGEMPLIDIFLSRNI